MPERPERILVYQLAKANHTIQLSLTLLKFN